MDCFIFHLNLLYEEFEDTKKVVEGKQLSTNHIHQIKSL